MGTLQSGSSPGQRLAAGDAVVERSKNIDKAWSKAIHKRLLDFRAAHKGYAAAHAASEKAHAAVMAQQRTIGEVDSKQDEAAHAWAAARIVAKEPRLRPFASIGGPSVGALVDGLTPEKEAHAIKSLAAKDGKHRDVRVKRAAALASKAADAVLRESKALGALVKARDAAISRREATVSKWEKTFAALKRTTKNADADGAAGVFAALFDAPAPPRAKKKVATVVHVNAAAVTVNAPITGA